MNILITGANGQLGSEMRNLAAKSKHNYIFTDVVSLPEVETTILDITKAESINSITEENNIDVIVNCAAYTNVDKAEEDVQTADLLNNIAAANLAAAAAQRGATLIHISTDYVFGGNASIPYSETDEVSPLGVYGRTKYAGEEAVRNSECKHIIIRTAWLYSPYGKNFVKTIKNLSAERDTLSVVFDQVGSPTYAADLAELISHIIENNMLDKTGTYHFSNEGVISWYDFAKAICELSGNTCDIKPVHSYEYPAKSERPHFSVLDKSKVKDTFSFKVPYWKDSLTACLSRL